MAVGNRLTAKEYLTSDWSQRPTELVRGEVVEMTPPGRPHGFVCSRIARLIGNFAEPRNLGWVMSNDTYVVTERDPDTVRGADVPFFTIESLPDPFVDDATAIPVLIFEVRSPSDRPRHIQDKAAEYLAAGVTSVVVIDPETVGGELFVSGQPPLRLAADDVVPLPPPLSGLQLTIREWTGRP